MSFVQMLGQPTVVNVALHPVQRRPWRSLAAKRGGLTTVLGDALKCVSCSSHP